MPSVGLQAIIRAVGTSAVLIVALLILYGVARLKLEPWWFQLIFAGAPIALLLAGVSLQKRRRGPKSRCPAA